MAGNSRFTDLMTVAIDKPGVLDQDGGCSKEPGAMSTGHLLCVMQLLQLQHGMTLGQHAQGSSQYGSDGAGQPHGC